MTRRTKKKINHYEVIYKRMRREFLLYPLPDNLYELVRVCFRLEPNVIIYDESVLQYIRHNLTNYDTVCRMFRGQANRRTFHRFKGSVLNKVAHEYQKWCDRL